MQLQIEKSRWIVRENLIHIDRPDSAKHVDLHVYMIPKEVWKNGQNSAENEEMARAVSIGFVRAPENLTIHDLRRYIVELCSNEQNFPKEFVYLRSVGRCLTKVKQQQEKQLKVKNYRPPTTFAPEIFILEENQNDDSSTTDRSISREPPLNNLTRKKASQESLTTLYAPQSIALAQLPAQNLLKLREEQDRLSVRQQRLARKRYEIEDQVDKEEAAVKSQTAFRNYRERQQPKQSDDAAETDSFETDVRKSTHRKDEDDDYDESRLSVRLQRLRIKRFELEASRDLVVRQLQQLQAQITIQRRQEKDLWKQRYLIEKNQIPAVNEQHRRASKDQIDLHGQLEQATMRLHHATKLRRQAEYESRALRQELQQISSSLNDLKRYRLPKRSHHEPQQQRQSTDADFTEQY